LKLAGFTGLLLCGAAFVMLLVLIVQALMPDKTIAPWSWVILPVLLFSGLQMVFIGIMGEYIGRIFKETKKRPLYFINEYHTSITTDEERQEGNK
jgi:chromate transport protein ChrA